MPKHLFFILVLLSSFTVQQALVIDRKISNRTGEGHDLYNIAAVHETQRDYAKAYIYQNG